MDKPEQYIVVQELSIGNAEVGSMWVDAASFPPTATLEEVFLWARERPGAKGRLMLTEDRHV